jgi:hypothetical protein
VAKLYASIEAGGWNPQLGKVVLFPAPVDHQRFVDCSDHFMASYRPKEFHSKRAILQQQWEATHTGIMTEI